MKEFKKSPYYDQFLQTSNKIDHKKVLGKLATSVLQLFEDKMPRVWQDEAEDNNKSNTTFYTFVMDAGAYYVIPFAGGFSNMSMYD
eukprot:CAMPEP_0170540192 /NCGR_PEP_ID=MMETSP0211-20121228/240_1 /TAXON_ID=311385 /ORGANISM="Pseudokeronopsis sp., Strain OXSARD2" /LENGTH=85 /DNA_ID=CAMNT_0010842501 /DNA_START=81 /DNA_END=338 /DNA_ORIENTATION=+